MVWSWQVARIAGIRIRLHVTFFLLLIWIGWLAWSSQPTLESLWRGLLPILLLFSSVVLHELGHALVARHYGLQTRDIVLLPIGGVARLAGSAPHPRAEIAIAGAGPTVSIVLAIGALGLAWAFGGSWRLTALPVSQYSCLELLGLQNIMLALFNLLPAFPMDGGRILRGALSLKISQLRATQFAVMVGRWFAFGLAILGMMYSPWLILIALFIWLTGTVETRQAEWQAALGEVPISAVMDPNVTPLAADSPLSAAVELTLAGRAKHFPVLAADQLVGFLTQADLVRGLGAKGPEARIGDLLRKDAPAFSPEDPVLPAMSRLTETAWQAGPVVRSGAVVGILDVERVSQFVQLKAAIAKNRPAPPGPSDASMVDPLGGPPGRTTPAR